MLVAVLARSLLGNGERASARLLSTLLFGELPTCSFVRKASDLPQMEMDLISIRRLDFDN